MWVDGDKIVEKTRTGFPGEPLDRRVREGRPQIELDRRAMCAMVEVPQHRSMEATPGASRPPVVLVVDDHEDTRHMSLLVLKSQGFTAVAADGGEMGFADACEQRPDVIVTDLAMPDGDGWEFVQRLSSDPRTKDIPVVMLTACATESVRQRAERRRRRGVLLQALRAGRSGG